MTWEKKSRNELIAEISRLESRCVSLEKAFARDVTERTRLETLYEDIFQQSPDGILLMETETGRVVEFNAAAHLQLGYSREEFCGKRISDWEAYETSDEIRERIRKALDEGCADFEAVHRKKDGTLRHVYVTTKLVDIGGTAYFYTVFRDVTERKRMEEELSKGKERNQALLDAIPDLLFVITHDGKIVDYKASDEQSLYAPPEVFLNRRFREIFPEAVADLFEGKIALVAREGRKTLFEYRLDVPVGQRHYEATCVPYGEKTILAVVRDITERKRAEEELLHSEQRFQTLASATFEGIAITEQGRFVDANDQLVNLLGYELNELIGMEVAAAIPPADRDRVLANIRNGKESHIDHEVVCKDGSRRFVEAHGKTIHQQGRQIRLTAIHDITERKHHEAELILARQAAESASRAKTVFLANMSHEIRTPMTGVIGMTELLRHTPLTEQQERYLETIELAANNLLALIEEILDLSTIEAGKVSLESRAFNLRQCLHEELLAQQYRAHQKQLSFTTDLGPDLPAMVMGDPRRVNQVLLNLLNNAVKFTDEGGITLTARVVTRKESRVTIEFSVADTGVGIPAQAVERIFAPFEQGDSSINCRYGGTGLGLAISRRLVEMMGGDIWVASTPGKGSTFSFVLPFRVAAASGAPEAAGFPTVGIPMARNALSILLAEDNDINRTFLAEILQREGHVVECAENGEEACRKWQPGAYDVIIMDIKMPVMDGIEALQHIRRSEEGDRRIPVIALTAHVLRGDREELLAAGFDGYLAKPVTGAVLTAELRRLVPQPCGGGTNT